MTDNESQRYNDSLCRDAALPAVRYLSQPIIRIRNPRLAVPSLRDMDWLKMKRVFFHGRGLLGR